MPGVRQGGWVDPVVALAQLGGVARVGDWKAMITRAEARDALASGAVVTLPRRQVALPAIDASRRAAASVGGAVSHLSAALHHGWKVKAPPPHPTLTVPRNRRLPENLPELELRWANLPSGAVTDGVTTPLQTVIDCSRAYAPDVGLAVADSALRSERVTQSELLMAARSSPRTGRSKAMYVARHATGLAANPFESVLRSIALSVSGLSVRPQGWIGNAGRADLVDDQLLIAIEADSWEHHGSRETFRHDVRRYAEFARFGWVVVRFLWEDVMHQPERVHRHLTEVAAIRTRQLGSNAGSSPIRPAG
jgi:very-short-patch-repair endonuclease